MLHLDIRDEINSFLAASAASPVRFLSTFFLLFFPFFPLLFAGAWWKIRNCLQFKKKSKFHSHLPLNYVFFPCLKIFMNFYKLSYNYHSNAEARLQLIPLFYKVWWSLETVWPCDSQFWICIKQIYFHSLTTGAWSPGISPILLLLFYQAKHSDSFV